MFPSLLAVPLILVALFAAPHSGPAQARGAVSDRAAVARRPERIQWFGTLEQGLAEAERCGRPILLSAATLRCDGVPGKW